ncbi:MAG: hypothetical protein ACRDXF_03625 [Acidimicrobiia bacterium]
MKVGRREKPKKKIAPWLMGLILAVIISVVALLVLDALGYGDDPSVGALAGMVVAADTTRR